MEKKRQNIIIPFANWEIMAALLPFAFSIIVDKPLPAYVLGFYVLTKVSSVEMKKHEGGAKKFFAGATGGYAAITIMGYAKWLVSAGIAVASLLLGYV